MKSKLTLFHKHPYKLIITFFIHPQLKLFDEVTLTRGDLPDVYRAIHVMFHWGGNNLRGSEHTNDGRHYPMEVYFSTCFSILSEIANRKIVQLFFVQLLFVAYKIIDDCSCSLFFSVIVYRSFPDKYCASHAEKLTLVDNQLILQ